MFWIQYQIPSDCRGGGRSRPGGFSRSRGRLLAMRETEREAGVPELDFKLFDCDNHYYEAADAFTRHLDPAFRKRAMQWGDIEGRRRLLVGGKINRFIPNPTWDPVSKPGALDDYFRGRNPGGSDTASLFGEL